MNKDKEFFDELDTVMKREYSKILKSNESSKIYSVEFEIELEKDIKEKYDLDDDISFTVLANGGRANIKYHYMGMEISPINYYSRPKNYHNVPTLTILTEAIRQKTHKPDIMFLERGEKIHV